MRRKLIVGNWKMNGSRDSNAVLLRDMLAARPFAIDVVVCAPFPYLAQVSHLLANQGIGWGAQDCSRHAQGAYTGEVSAQMLCEFGCQYVIVGHSERRQHHAESDEWVADKAQAALAQGLTPIVCVGETQAQREAGEYKSAVRFQLDVVIRRLGPLIGKCVVAYEPRWAIGTGRAATPEQVQSMHVELRSRLALVTPHAAEMKLLYGGSVKSENAALLFAQQDIDGGLIGGASLNADEFNAICHAVDVF
jgi:triosephosphate isomerase